jgi:hypothetical protein
LLDEQGRTLQKAAGVESHTYGRYGAYGDAFDAPAGDTTLRNYKWPFDLDIIEGTIYLDGTASGDVASFMAAPNTPLNVVAGLYFVQPPVPPPGVPVLAAPAAVNDTQITLVPGFLVGFVDLALIDAGMFEVTVTDGVTAETAYVTGYDKVTGVVTLGQRKFWSGGPGDEPPGWTGFANAYGTNAMVLVTRELVDKIELDGGVSALVFGRAARGAAPLPKNVLLQLVYVNNGQAARRIRVSFDILTGVPISAGG